MNNSFLDSNICVYVYDNSDTRKQQKAFNLLKDMPFISSQVIIETHNACLKKLKLNFDICDENILQLCNISRIIEINESVMRCAISFKKKYHFSFLDAMIVAAAYFSHSPILYSEDMQQLKVEKQLTIINPFL